MDAYPPELVAHETPLLLVSGLGAPELYADLESDARYSYPLLAENGTRVASTVPPVTTPAGELLLGQFLKADSSGIWAGRTAEKLKSQTPAWRIRAVGRVFIYIPLLSKCEFTIVGDWGFIGSMMLTCSRIIFSPRGRRIPPPMRVLVLLLEVPQLVFRLFTPLYHRSLQTLPSIQTV